MELPSKELLSKVLGVYTYLIDYKNIGGYANTIRYWESPNMQVIPNSINIHELAYRCKEKAREYGYSITTSNRVDGTNRYDVLCIHKDEGIECSFATFFNEIVDTEPNGIFMAMQWILDNKHK